MISFKEALHHIAVPPSYYSQLFFCPVKRDTILAAWSCAFLWVSATLHDAGIYLDYFSSTWSVIAKMLSGLILIMNFTMITMALIKRIRDWKKPEPEEGSEEYQKRHKP
jgi:hypothetical protein